MSTTKTPRRAPESLAACLGAAQSEAERLQGRGPVRVWQPSIDWRSWAVGAALATLAAGALLWLHDDKPAGGPSTGAAADQQVAMAHPGATAPAAVTGEAATRSDAPAAADPSPPPAAEPPAAAPVLPDNMEAWALDPQPLATRTEDEDAARAPVSLVNTPETPDEQDPTPADESAPDEAAFESPAE